MLPVHPFEFGCTRTTLQYKAFNAFLDCCDTADMAMNLFSVTVPNAASNIKTCIFILIHISEETSALHT